MVLTSAHFSPCRTWRYSLIRRWDLTNDIPRYCTFICLNPSTADETTDDPTVTRLQVRARELGYDGLIVVNLFAMRSTDPRKLTLADDPVGPDNDLQILRGACSGAMVVCAWGNDGVLYGRGRRVKEMLRKHAPTMPLHHLGLSKTGEPKHPLYLPYSQQPILWT